MGAPWGGTAQIAFLGAWRPGDLGQHQAFCFLLGRRGAKGLQKFCTEGEAPKCLNLVADYARTDEEERVLLEHLFSCASDGPAVMVGRLKGYGVQIKMRSARLRL